MAELVLPLQLTLRARRGQLVQHAVPAVYLVLIGLEALLAGEGNVHWLDGIGLITGLLLLFLFKRSWRDTHSTAHAGIGWYDVVAGVVIFIEGLHKYHSGKYFQPATLTMVLGVLVVLMGLNHARFQSLRKLTITDAHFTVRTGLLRSLTVPWSEFRSVALHGNTLQVTTNRSSRKSISLRRIENRDAVCAAISTSAAAAVT